MICDTLFVPVQLTLLEATCKFQYTSLHVMTDLEILFVNWLVKIWLLFEKCKELSQTFINLLTIYSLLCMAGTIQLCKFQTLIQNHFEKEINTFSIPRNIQMLTFRASISIIIISWIQNHVHLMHGFCQMNICS